MTADQDRLPLDAEDSLRLELSVLAGEVVELRPVYDAAHYVSGPAGCVDEDPECDEATGDGEWCSHVTHRFATHADVLARTGLEQIVAWVMSRLGDGQPVAVAELRDEVDEAVYALACALNEEGPAGAAITTEAPYARVVEAELDRYRVAGMERHIGEQP
jgi:hypothetical protein